MVDTMKAKWWQSVVITLQYAPTAEFIKPVGRASKLLDSVEDEKQTRDDEMSAHGKEMATKWWEEIALDRKNWRTIAMQKYIVQKRN